VKRRRGAKSPIFYERCNKETQQEDTMSDYKKSVLIGIDGSVQSIGAAGYISGILPPDKTRIVLYHVDAEVMDLYFDVEDKPDKVDFEKASYSDWIAMRKKNMAARLEKTRDMFIEKIGRAHV
jgi:hypothetical protein